MKFAFLCSIARQFRSYRRALSGRRRIQRLPSVQQLECRTLLASVMDSGTTLRFELEGSERLQITSAGSSYAFTSTSSTFTDTGVTESGDFAGFGTADLTLTDLAQYVNVQIVDTAAGASAQFPGSGANAFVHNFDITLDDGATSQSVVFNGGTHFGNHNLTAITDGSIQLFTGTDLTVADGDIDLTAVNSGQAQGALRGIGSVSASITTTGAGHISLNGTATSTGPVSDFRIGVSMQDNSSIRSTSSSSTAGTITLNGTGGDGADNNPGLDLNDAVISSVMGDISLTGIGGGGSGSHNSGVRVKAGTTIESTGTSADAATIAIDGTGGAAASWNVGLVVDGDSIIRSVDGDISSIGRGGAGTDNNNVGFRFDEFRLESTGTGANAAKIDIHGIGGGGTHNNGGGSLLGVASEIRTVDGAVTLNAESGLDSSEYSNGGIWVAASVRATGTATIDITGTGGIGTQHNRGVDVVGETTVVQSTVGAITIHGSGGNTTLGSTGGVQIHDSATISSAEGDITVTGFGGHGGSFNEGVGLKFGAVVASTGTGPNAAKILLDGTAGSGENWNVGLAIARDVSVSTVDGNVQMVGVGGVASGANNRGVNLSNFDGVRSTGTGANAANITITGTGGSGSDHNYGFLSSHGDYTAEIASVDGDILIVANAGQNLTGQANGGAWVKNVTRSTGTGSVTINGTATAGTSFNRGVLLTGDDVEYSTHSGDLTINGTGGAGTGNQNEGVVIHRQASVVTNSGTIAINGSSGANNSHGVEIWGTSESGGRILSLGSGDIQITATGIGDGVKTDFKAYTNTIVGGPSANGNISISAGTVEIHPDSLLQSSGGLTIAPYTAGSALQSISLGGTYNGSRTDLHLDVDELATISPDFSSITIGSAGLPDNQNIVLIDAISLDSPTTIIGGRIHDTPAPDLDIPVVTLLGSIEPGESPGVLDGAHAVALASGSRLVIEAAGASAGDTSQSHDQLRAGLQLDIQPNVELDTVWIPSWRPKGGEQLTIVQRTGGTGTFDGLNEGAILADFFNASISYVGGDGDDIVLTLPNSLPALPTQINLGQISTAGITIYGDDPDGRAGQSVNSAGDVNGDGIDDFLIGASSATSSSNNRMESGLGYLVYGSAQPAAAIDLATLGSQGVVFLGADANQNTGHFIDAGDFNNDGYSDILIGAHRRPGANGAASGGGAYVVWGGPSLPDTIDLASLGSAGITILGPDADDLAGNPVAAVGDINNDGFEDFALGAIWADGPSNNRDRAGESHVIFGGDNLPTTIDLASASAGILKIYGAQIADESGVSVAQLGDVNGDSIDDLIIGARFADGANDAASRAGESYIIYGKGTFPAALDLASDADVVVYGIDVDDFSGWPARGGGDVNGDGYNDIVIGANGADSVNNNRSNAGESYIIWGGPTLPAEIHANNLGSAGITIFGRDSGDNSGRSVDIVGDLNADGYDDVAIGGYLANGNQNASSAAGEVYLILGGPSLPTTIDLNAPHAADFILYGADAGDSAGIMVRGAGDVNDDGIADLIIGSRFADSLNNARPNAGEAYVVFGNSLFVPDIPLVTGPAGQIANQRPVITWAEAAAAESYELWLELIGGDSNPVANPTSITGTSYQLLTDLGIGRYRSWLRSNRGDGSHSAWSTATFSISLATVVHDLSFHGDDLRPTISWDAVDGATAYRVYISNVTLQTSAVVDQVVNDTSLTLSSDLQFGRHRIWVRPIGAGNFAAEWSAAEEYYIGPDLLAPVTSTLNDRPTFSWTDLPSVDTVQLYVQQGSTVVINETGIAGSHFTPETSLANGNYRWWIRPFAANGRAGAWSELGRFHVGGSTTITGPTGPVSSGIAIIEWEPVDGAGTYEIYLFNDDGVGLIHRQTGLTGTTFTSAPLVDGNYRVWIRSYRTDGTAALWSRSHAFTVESAVAGLTTLLTGPDKPTFDTTPDFHWSASTEATSFNIYLTNGSSVVQQSVAQQAWTPQTPLSAGEWQWWVQAVNAAGETGPWSDSATVDTSGRAVLLAPTGATTDATPTFQWTAVTGAERYILQVDNLATGTTVIREEMIIDSSFTPASSLGSGNFRAWVRAIGAGNSFAPWSIQRDFEIV